MHKLLPFRQYDEKDVINLFSLDVSTGAGSEYINLKPGGKAFNNGGNWSGTLVDTASTNNKLGADQPARTNDSYLGAIGSDDQGFAMKEGSIYPTTQMSFGVVAADAASAVGLTLRPTLAWDENMMKLLNYDVKKDELQAVLPGEAVPVATKGFFTVKVGKGAATLAAGIFHASGIGSGGIVPGSNLKAGGSGQLTLNSDGKTTFAKVIATGAGAGEDVALIQLG